MIKEKYDNCFLCEPKTDWVFMESENFFAMVGLGAFIPGYSIIVSKQHIPSMLDISKEIAREYLSFSNDVIKHIEANFGDLFMTEHGRMGVCLDNNFNVDSHCQHAHQLIFPLAYSIKEDLLKLYPDYSEYKNYEEFLKSDHKREYLMLQDIDKVVYAVNVFGNCMNQLFRRLVASKAEKDPQFDWRKYPNYKITEETANKLKISGGGSDNK